MLLLFLLCLLGPFLHHRLLSSQPDKNVRLFVPERSILEQFFVIELNLNLLPRIRILTMKSLALFGKGSDFMILLLLVGSFSVRFLSHILIY